MPPVREWSLRLRLSVFFTALMLAGWCTATVWVWHESSEYIDEFFDTQQMLFARRLAAVDYSSITTRLPDAEEMLPDGGEHGGRQEDDALGFAVFDSDGELLLSDGDNGEDFVFDGNAGGFVNSYIRDSDDKWRIVWVPSLDGRVTVAVGQELEYRDDMALEMLAGQMLPWLLLLPVLLAGLVWMLNRELAPLRTVASSLKTRAPDDVRPIESALPPEVRPLADALNSLFKRTASMLQRERAFISDAAHELRTPLAGLSVQAQVAAGARQESSRAHALEQLIAGTGRANRLVDQLLLLFRLESAGDAHGQAEEPSLLAEKEDIALAGLVDEAVSEYSGQMEGKNITLTQKTAPGVQPVAGNRDLLAALLRNLVGNAVKYAPEGGRIEIDLSACRLRMGNSAGDLSELRTARLGERFYRPPGQAEPGSGLGLSIVRRIAQIHGINLAITAKDGWFEVTVTFGPKKT